MNYMQNGKNILLHVCCGPCSTSSVERLLAEGWNPVLYFSNSNIDTKEEFEKRYAELLKVAALNGLRVIKDDYDHASWLSAISGFEDEREGGARCLICFDFNLRRAAIKAKELVIDDIELVAMQLPVITVRVVCSKGTYIRALARDIGEALGSGAHLVGLRRTRVGDVGVDDCEQVSQLIERLEKEEMVLPEEMSGQK